jgi:hypothetical protein
MKPIGRVPVQRLLQLEHGASSTDLLERILCPKNLCQAWLQVKANGGAAGADGITIAQFPAFARQHWPKLRSRLLAGTYHPAPVRRVFIAKSNGDLRPLGIPMVLDLIIQQAIAQVLTPLFDPHFSAHSYGFRYGKRAHQAVRSVQAAAQAGYCYAVDCDLESSSTSVSARPIERYRQWTNGCGGGCLCTTANSGSAPADGGETSSAWASTRRRTSAFRNGECPVSGNSGSRCIKAPGTRSRIPRPLI